MGISHIVLRYTDKASMARFREDYEQILKLREAR